MGKQGCLKFMSHYCITDCVPARLSAGHVTILHYSVCAARMSAVQVTIQHYSMCASKAVCSSCHHTALEYVRQQGCLQFMSPYCITVCVPASVSAVYDITLHNSVTASKAVCSSCQHNSSQCVCQQDCLQFMSTYCI